MPSKSTKKSQPSAALDTVFHSAPVPLLIASKGGLIDAINPVGLALFGCKPADIVGQPVDEFLRPPYGKKKITKTQAFSARKSQVSSKGETYLVSKGGDKTSEVDVKSAPIKNGRDSKVLLTLVDAQYQTELKAEAVKLKSKLDTQVMLHGIDIKEMQMLHEELLSAKEIAEKANQTKSEFLATMSHELRTPLNSIIGFSEVLIDEHFGPLNEKQKEYVGDVLESGEHLLELINDVLDLSKVEAGHFDLQIENLPLELALTQSILFVKERAAKHNIQIKTNINESIGYIDSDERKIKQIMVNLLSNAIKFTPDGGEIGIDAHRRDDGFVEVSVWDTGIGIDDKDKHKVFTEFEQIDNAMSRKYSGAGLGMPLCKKFVGLLGGEIWFESKGMGCGTRFYFTLPADLLKIVEHEMGSPAEDTKKPKPKKQAKDKEESILIIEDSDASAQLMGIYTTEMGFKTIICNDGKEGLEKAIKICPSLILLDIRLPTMSGWEILAKLKRIEKTKDIPVIIISIMERKDKVVTMGAVDFIPKPISRDGFMSTIEKHREKTEYES